MFGDVDPSFDVQSQMGSARNIGVVARLCAFRGINIAARNN